MLTLSTAPNSVLIETANTSRFVAEIDSVTSDEWHEYLALFDDATVYQSWPYGTVCWGDRNLSHIVLKEDGDVVAIAQIRIAQLPLVRKGIAYVRWGPLWRLCRAAPNQAILERILLELRKEYVEKRGLMLRVVPNLYRDEPFAALWNSASQTIGLNHDPRVHIYRTMRVDLSLSLEKIRAGLHPRWRNYLRTAEKTNYNLLEGTNIELYETFLTLYRQMMARKQFETTVNVDDFKFIQRQLASNLKMRVLVCEKDGRALNALVISQVGDTGIYLLAATGTDGLKERGAHLLQWRAMQFLKERGCRWYDLGGINPDKNPGVFQFKSGLGGVEVQQLGGFEISRSWLNSAIVTAGEHTRSIFKAISSKRR